MTEKIIHNNVTTAPIGTIIPNHSAILELIKQLRVHIIATKTNIAYNIQIALIKNISIISTFIIFLQIK